MKKYNKFLKDYDNLTILKRAFEFTTTNVGTKTLIFYVRCQHLLAVKRRYTDYSHRYKDVYAI